MCAAYDTIGVNYSNLRKPDPRIASMITEALGSAETVLNVGAGTGSYEPSDRAVTALEPSIEMIGQRGRAAAPVVRGHAETLPFSDKTFDASMAVLTVHHWADQAEGLRELRRVTRGPVVVVTFDPLYLGFWLADYLPELVTLDEAQMPEMTAFEAWLGPVEITPIPIPHDCADGFLSAYWRRPAAYLDANIRKAISCFWTLGDISVALEKLESDLNSGAWAQRYGDLLDLDAHDCGYRLVTTKG